MRMRVLPSLAALVLGAATALLVACGSDGRIPASDASSLTSALNQIMAMPSPSPDDRVSVERGPDRRGVLAGRTAAISVEVMTEMWVEMSDG